MGAQFKYFAVLAGMRTGSNLLEERLNSIEGIQCLGEVFNPAFVGHANQTELLGMTPSDIAQHPDSFLDRLITAHKGLVGFRLFDGHNQHILGKCLVDPDCAKIILRRNPIESYVSLKIAQKTNQWRMNDAKSAKKAKIEFEPSEFSDYLASTQAHYSQLARTLKAAGQTAFLIDYSEINDPDILSGLARFLGFDSEDFGRKSKTKKQNPDPLSEKVTNFDEMIVHLGQLDPIGLFDDPSFEPNRGPDVKSYVISDANRLQFMPIVGGPNRCIQNWMNALADGQHDLISAGYSQKQLRSWKRENPGHVAFTVIRHPALRAWYAFRTHLVQPGKEHFNVIRKEMIERYEIALPEVAELSEQTTDALQNGFLSFLRFLPANLSGQTSIRVDASWASQIASTEAFGRFAPVHMHLREDNLERELAFLAEKVGAKNVALPHDTDLIDEFSRVYSPEIEAAAREAYRRDYMAFGFGPWRAS